MASANVDMDEDMDIHIPDMDLSEDLEFPVELRKIRRLDNIFKKKDKDAKAVKNVLNNEQWELMELLEKDDTSAQLKALQTIKTLMVDDSKKTVTQSFIANDIITKCVQLIATTELPIIATEALLILHLISYGSSDDVKALTSCDQLVPLLIDLLDSSLNLAEKAVLTLGNIAADSADSRDYLLTQELVDPLVDLCKRYIPSSFLVHLSWMLSNLCRTKNLDNTFEVIKPLLPSFRKFLKESKDKEVLFNITMAIHRITYDKDKARIDAVCECRLVPRLIKLLNIDFDKLLSISSRALANISSGTLQHVDKLVDANILQKANILLKHSDREIAKHTLIIIGNICAHTSNHIQAVIDGNVFTEVTHILSKSTPEGKLAAATILTNASKNGTKQQIVKIFESTELMAQYFALLDSNDVNCVKIVLTGLCNLLRIAGNKNELEKICSFIEMIGALEKLEALQYHENECIRKNAAALVDTYFSKNNEDVASIPTPVSI